LAAAAAAAAAAAVAAGAVGMRKRVIVVVMVVPPAHQQEGGDAGTTARPAVGAGVGAVTAGGRRPLSSSFAPVFVGVVVMVVVPSVESNPCGVWWVCTGKGLGDDMMMIGYDDWCHVRFDFGESRP
jgi:hypothetical protein